MNYQMQSERDLCWNYPTCGWDTPLLPGLRRIEEQAKLDVYSQIFQGNTVLQVGRQPRLYLAPQNFEVVFIRSMNNILFLLGKEVEQFEIENFSTEDKSEISVFLENYPYLFNLVMEAKSEIAKYFPDAELILEVLTDPESDEESAELVLSILTDLEVRESITRLDEFDRNWWDKNIRRAKGNLCITVNYK